MISCSDRLDWEDKTRSRLNWLTIALFAIAGVLLILLATFLRMVIGPTTFVGGLYWSIAFATGYGAGGDPSSNAQFGLSITWMLLCVTYWAALFGAVTTWIGDFFER